MVRVVLVVLMLLAGCGGGSSYQQPVVEQPVVEQPVVEQPVVEQPVVEPPVAEPPVVAAPVRTYELIPQHVEVMLNTGQIVGELPVAAQVSEQAPIGASAVTTAQAASFLPGQLVVLLGDDGKYHTEKVSSVEASSIALSRPLPYAVVSGGTLWSFYQNFAHPQAAGYYAIADYAYQAVGPITEGRHVFLGDSWFSNRYLMERIKLHSSPTAVFINRGVGGNTVQNLLNRFDADVTPEKPTHVWVMAGTNDYFRRYPVSTYTRNLQALVDKIHAIGAHAIVFDASVGPQSYGAYQSFELKYLSDEYAEGARAEVW